MASEKASVLSVFAVILAFGSLVAAWLAVPGFPYSPFRPAQPQSTNIDTKPVTTAEPPSDSPPPTITHSRKTTSRKASVEEPVSQVAPDPQPIAEARVLSPVPSPEPTAPATVMPSSVPTVVIEREPAASDGYYRGTVVTCQEESNVPGSGAKLCIDLGQKVVSVATNSQLYVLIGGWNRRIPLYPGDVIRFEVRRGELASAELLSDPHGR